MSHFGYVVLPAGLATIALFRGWLRLAAVEISALVTTAARA